MDLRSKSADAIPSGAPGPATQPGSLTGIRVIEMADEQAEYCGLMLAGLGADVIKVEPPGGSPTRRIGPFYQDKPDPEGSLFFWQYNRGKRSVVLDLDSGAGPREAPLAAGRRRRPARVDAEGQARGDRPRHETLRQAVPDADHARITPFGDDGPWSRLQGLATSFISRSAA